MRSNLFWLSDEQWARIEPHLPTNVRGKERVDDRRVISGILHVLTSGCCWKDCPPEYGSYTTVYNRFAGLAWKAHRQPRMRENIHRLVFLDETGMTTKMTRLRGRARRGTPAEGRCAVRTLDDPDLHRRAALRPDRAMGDRSSDEPRR